jgi:hypothetical protein
LEPRFVADFARVRLHTNAQADRAAEAVGALAYTVGPHIVFRAGQYQPLRRQAIGCWRTSR